MKRMFVVLAVAGIFAGCTQTVSEQNYAAVQEALRGSPKMRLALISDCTSEIQSKSTAKMRRDAALIMNTDERKVAALLCQRTVEGLASGKLTHSDVNSVMRGQITPSYVRLVQNR